MFCLTVIYTTGTHWLVIAPPNIQRRNWSSRSTCTSSTTLPDYSKLFNLLVYYYYNGILGGYGRRAVQYPAGKAALHAGSGLLRCGRCVTAPVSELDITDSLLLGCGQLRASTVGERICRYKYAF